MKRRPVVLLDVDGVLRDFIGALCTHLNALHGTDHTPELFTEYDLRAMTLTEAQAFAVWVRTPEAYQSLRWYPGAREFLFWLRGLATVRAITSTDQYHKAVTVKFLHPYITERNVLFAAPEIKASAPGDILIEDHPNTVSWWAEEHPSGLAILLDRPWNQHHIQTHDRVVRAHTYRHAKTIIQERIHAFHR